MSHFATRYNQPCFATSFCGGSPTQAAIVGINAKEAMHGRGTDNKKG
jgi:hypothetical protein